jgi:hypothetical protein
MVRDAIGLGDRIGTHAEMFRTATEFQARGKCFELFPGESLDDSARRRISWFVG